VDQLQKHTYLYLKDILAYAKSVYRISYTVSGSLKRHKFSYKKPALVPGKANEEQQRQWISEYEKLKAEPSPDEQFVLWMACTLPITHN